MLTPFDLLQIRKDAALELPDMATVKSRFLTSNERGGQVPAWAGAVEIACRLEFASGDVTASYSDQVQGGSVKPQQLYVVTTAYDAAVVETDHLAINGQEFEIVTELKARSEMISRRFLVKAV